MKRKDLTNRSKTAKPAKRRKKRKPGLLKQPKRKPVREKRSFGFAGALGFPKLIPGGRKDAGQQQGVERAQAAGRGAGRSRLTREGRTPQSVTDRRRRNNWRSVTATTWSIRKFVGSARMLSLSLLICSLVALYLIGENPRFYLSRIDIEGASIIQRSEVVQASRISGTHVFAVEPDLVAEAVGNMPGIVAAQVDLNWPDRLHITIEEDTPILNWRENGRDFWVNREGTLVPAFGQDMNLLTVVANVPSPVQPLPEFDDEGNEIPVAPKLTYLDFVPANLIETALQLDRKLPEIEQLTYAPQTGLQFRDGRGWTAMFGSDGDLVVKLAVYDSIVENLQVRGIVPEYINVAYPQKPVFKPLSGYEAPTEPEEG